MAGKRLVESRNYSDLPAADSLAPNVLLLIIDTGRGDHLTPYGYERATTPRIQQLADSGSLYEWALSAAPTTLPSHASMFTGKLVKEHHAGWRGRPFLDNRFPTIAEFMQSQGYQTAGFVANVFWAGRHTGLDRGFHHYEDYYGTPFDGITRTILGRALAYWILPRLGRVDIPGRKSAELVNRELLSWLSWTPEDRPFFAMVNYLDVHAPYLPPPGFANRLSRKSTYRTTRIEIGAWREHNRMPSEAILQEWRDRYDESLMYLDHQIGNLVDSLTGHARQRNTVIIITADHGESFGDHGTLHHGGSLHQEQVRVPLILWGPGIVAKGTRVSTPVDLRSLPATIADLTEPDRVPFPGTSLLEIGDSTSAAPAVSEGPYLAGNPDEWQTGRGWVASVLKGRHHLIALESGEYDLYDVRQDPTEAHDLADMPEGKQIIGKLQEDLKRVTPDSGSGAKTGNRSPQD